MSYRDIKLCLEGNAPAESVPLWELEFQCWDNFSDKKVCLGNDFISLSDVNKEQILHTNAEIIADVATELSFSAVSVPNSYWEISPGEPAYYWLPEEFRYKQAQMIYELLNSDIMLVGISGGVYGMPPADMYVDFSLKLFDSPDEIEELFLSTFKKGVESATKLRDAGVQAVVTATDIADNKGPFYTPEQMDKFIISYLYKWANSIRKMELYAIMHTDGNVYPCLSELADSGIHALQAIDPIARMDMLEALQIVNGRICLCGNIDCGLLLSGTVEQIYEQTKKLLLMCKSYNGIVLGASNAVVTETPSDNYKAMIKAWKEYGKLTLAK